MNNDETNDLTPRENEDPDPFDFVNEVNEDHIFVCPLCELHFDMMQYRAHMLYVHPEFVAIWASTMYGTLFREDEYIDFVRRILQDNDVDENDGPDVDNMTYDELLQLCEQIGNHKEGVADVKKVVTEATECECCEVKCPICLERFQDIQQQKPVKLKRCKHVFCLECINTWFKENKSCPVCKQDAVPHEDT